MASQSAIEIILSSTERRLIRGGCLTFAGVPFRDDKADIGIDPSSFLERVYSILSDACTSPMSQCDQVPILFPADDICRLCKVLAAILLQYPKDNDMELGALIGLRSDIVSLEKRLKTILSK